MSTKFEQLLDYLVNEETDKANELFHEIVVEKSREIYQNLIAEEEEAEMDEASEEDDESMEEAAEEEDDESVEESMEDETVESMFGEEEDEFPIQDKTDDLEGDTMDHDAMGDDDGFGGDEGGDGTAPATKDDVQDLEDALEELKAEFEALMSAERNEEENEPGVHDDETGHDPLDDVDGGAEDDEDDEEDDEDDEEDEGESMKESRGAKSQGEMMREYIEKVAVTMADGEGVGSGRGDKAGQTGHDSGKSPISSGSGKPTSGANAKNIAQAGKGADEDGTKPHGKLGGVLKKGADVPHMGDFENVEKSSRSTKNIFSTAKKPASGEGHGVGAQTGGEKAGQTGGSTNTKSVVGKKL
jgi:hypothetical protein